MQVTVDQSNAESALQKLEAASELWPQYIRLVALLIQRSLAEFVSPLLMVGLILSMSNFLLDDAIFRFSPAIPFVWALVQCVAIDANLGFMLVRSVKNFHQGEIIKGIIFLAISLSLLFVAAIIFDTEALQSVVGHLVGVIIPTAILTLIRGCAIVALVAAGPLESISLKIHRSSKPSLASDEPPDTDPEVPSPTQLMLAISALADLVARVETLQPPGTTLVVSHETVALDVLDVGGNQAEPLAEPVELTEEQKQRLEQAYVQMQAEGKKIGVNLLRMYSGVRKEAASSWLKQRENGEVAV